MVLSGGSLLRRSSRLGLEVIVEHYVHDDGAKLFWLLLIRIAAWCGAALGLFAVLKLALAPEAGL